ncbi:hypothetical protein [Singulisphaera sp. PoT]|uniref:hypothetical protein n=1 Tax=Singulisphaera sp. PoT TaxID=3411797 RepID=UPI003BF613B7
MILDERRSDEGGSHPYNSTEAASTSAANPLHLALAELQGEFVTSEPPSTTGSTPSQAPRGLEASSTATAVATAAQDEARPTPPSRVEAVPDADFEDSSYAAQDDAADDRQRAPILFGQPARTSPGIGMLIGLAFASTIFGIVGAWLYSMATGTAAATPAKASAWPEDDRAADGKDLSPFSEKSKVAILSTDVESLKSMVSGFSDRLDDVQKRLGDLPQGSSTPSPDLTPLQRQVDELGRATRGISVVSEDLSKLSARLDAVEKAQKASRTESAKAAGHDGPAIESPRTNAPANSTPPANTAAATPSSAPAPNAGTTPNGTMVASPSTAEAEPRETSPPAIQPIDEEGDPITRAANLFRQGKYEEALTAFTALQKATPDDARVWYFSALSRGFAKKQWTGDTLKLVQKGVVSEKAGKPPKAEIDAAFRNLSGENVKNDNGRKWLEFYRDQAKAQ